jgi:hypothetical protein
MPFRSPKKVLQQRRVLLLALYVLKRRGHGSPPKAQVLRFIDWQKLMNVPADDLGLRSTGDEVWQNDLAWKREDIKEDGLLDMPERGIWHLTKKGEEEVEAWAQRVKELAEAQPNFAQRYESGTTDDLGYEYYVTPKVFEFALKTLRPRKALIFDQGESLERSIARERPATMSALPRSMEASNSGVIPSWSSSHCSSHSRSFSTSLTFRCDIAASISPTVLIASRIKLELLQINDSQRTSMVQSRKNH